MPEQDAAPRITFESPWDLYLSIGATVQALNTFMCGNDNIEIRWCNGQSSWVREAFDGG